MFRYVSVILLMSTIYALAGETSILDQYIETALESNLALQQQEFSYEKSAAALQEARGLFFPAISLNARYSRAGGGRQIEIPVGQFVNPVYQTLNYLLQQNVFPEDIGTQTFPFLREEEQETKIRAVQPLFKPEIVYNYQIKNHLKEIEEAGKEVYARQLVAEVKTAYFDYLKALEIINFLDQTQELLNENLRVNEKLVENQKATWEVVYRARADLSLLEKQRAEAEKSLDMARAYFNFLLNRPQENTIDPVRLESVSAVLEIDLIAAENQALSNRQELKQLAAGVEAARSGIKLNRSTFLPGIFAVLDYGFQGKQYRFSKKDDFWMASAILEWNLFNGFQDKSKIQQATLEKKKIEARRQELENQIRLEVREAWHNLVVAGKDLQSTRDRLDSQKKSFEIMDKKYQQGMALQVEYLDARNNYLQSEIQQVVATFDYHIRQAEFERAVAGYDLKKAQSKQN
jgi:outer membrane protein